MSKIHSLSLLVLCIFILASSRVATSQTPAMPPAQAVKPASATPSVPIIGAPPAAPTFKSPLMNGDFTITGTAQKPTADFSMIAIYVCIVTDKPKGALTSCIDPSTSVGPAALKDPTAKQTSAEPPATVEFTTTDKNGNFTAHLLTPLIAGQYVYVTQFVTIRDKTGKEIAQQPSESANSILVSSFTKTAPIGTAVVGLDVTGASSTNPQPVFLGLGMMDIPLSSDPSKGRFFDSLVWANAQLRIAGMAQPGTLTGALGSTASAASYLESSVNANPDNIVQSLEGIGSISFKFKHWDLPVDTFDVGNYQPVNKLPTTIVSLQGIISLGAITPLSVSQANPPVYNLTSQIVTNYSSYFPANCTLTPGSVSTSAPACCPPSASSTTCYVSFMPTDRTRFYRHYETGLRLKLYGGDYDDSDKKYRFPGMADFTIGQNEYVTGGKLSHFVLHIGGVMPLPLLDGGYIFGSMDTELSKAANGGAQLILTPATSTSTTPLTYASSSVTNIPVSQPNRDRYQIGIGLDIYHLVSSLAKKTSATTAGTTSGQ
jgi:hypothetical protein